MKLSKVISKVKNIKPRRNIYPFLSHGSFPSSVFWWIYLFLWGDLTWTIIRTAIWKRFCLKATHFWCTLGSLSIMAFWYSLVLYVRIISLLKLRFLDFIQYLRLSLVCSMPPLALGNQTPDVCIYFWMKYSLTHNRRVRQDPAGHLVFSNPL